MFSSNVIALCFQPARCRSLKVRDHKQSHHVTRRLFAATVFTPPSQLRHTNWSVEFSSRICSAYLST